MPKGKKVKSDAPPTKKQVSEGAATGVAADSSKAVAATALKPDKSAPSPAQKNEPKPVDQGKTGGNGNEKKNDKQEEMDAERELADDAAWKRIQQNTFTRWANEHLKTANKNIGSLETDLADGLRLIALIEVLSAKKLGKHNKKPSFRSQKLENCSVALKFLMQDEGIKIVNIDSTDIVDCKLKLILGLIWTLILHYSISMPMWEGEDEGQTKGKSATPKQRLLGWIKSKVPDLPIQNFTSDWNNGKAIGALVDAVAPGLCPDWEDWDPKNALKNAQEAMELANKWLDVPELIRPAELTNPNIDEMSVMTYLSQFPKAKLKPGAPLRPRTNPKKVRAYGPGIEPSGVICGVPTNFTVETFSAGKGDVEVEVQNSKNQKEPAEIKYNDDKAKTFTVKYTPKMEGPHKVKVNFAGKEIPKSPFPVEVKGFTGDPGKVVAKGPGLEPTGVIANKPTHFDVDTREAGLGCIDVLVEDPDKSTNTVPCKVTDNGDGTYHCEYAPNKEGDHNVNVLFAGRLASQSPFKVNVAPSAYPHKVVAKGPGLEPTGVRATNPTYFDIDAREAGLGKAEVTIEDPDKSITTVPLKVTDKGDGTYRCEYEPKKEGMHNVTVKFAGKPIQKDPFKVNVGPATDPSQVVAKGPGLEPNGVTASKPTSFDVDTTAAGVGKLEVSIEDPEKSTKTVPCKIVDKGNGAYHCEYEPKKSGLHNVNITLAGKPIQKSPFKVNVGPASDARKVRASGRGLQANGVRVADAADFKIYTDGAGDGQVDVKVVGPNGQPIAIEMKKLTPTTYETIYRPTMVGRHVVLISYGGTEIPKSPYEVNVGPFKESKIRAFGPGLYGGMVNKPASFTVETNGETGSLGFSIEGPSQTKIDCKDNGDGSANVTYYPTAPGDYAVHILCDNEDIPKSPYMAAIIPEDPKFSPEKVEAYGPGLEENGVAMGKPTEFTIDTKKAGGTGPLEVSVMDANYQPLPVTIKDNKDGTIKCEYKPENPSRHTVQVNYAGQATPKSPYRVNISSPSDASKVKVFGPGVENGNKPQKQTHFNIDCKDAGDGEPEVVINNEKGDEIEYSIQDNLDKTYTVEYAAPAPGKYKVQTKYGGKEVPKSPIDVEVKSDIDVSKVRVDGLEPNAPINSLQQFRVITKDAGPKGPSDLAITITSPTNKVIHGHIVPTPEGFLVSFTPTELGEYLLGISFGGESVAPSPFKMLCTSGAPSDNDKVKAYGPGLQGGVVNKPAEFTIDAKEATTQGGLGVTIEGPSEAPINCKDNGDRTCSVSYLPKETGNYNVNVTHNNAHIKGSPFPVTVTPDEPKATAKQAQAPVQAAPGQKGKTPKGKGKKSPPKGDDQKKAAAPVTTKASPVISGAPVDIGKIKASGNGIQPQGVFKDCPTDFTIDAREVTNKLDGKVTCIITNPSGNKTNSTIENQNNGMYKVCYSPFEEGPHSIQITYDGVPIPGSPFKVNVTKGCDPSKCKAYGPGLEKGITGTKNTFIVETKGAGVGGLGLTVEGPAEAQMNCVDNRDGTCTIEYVPDEAGDYDIGIKFADQDIPGSPFKVPVEIAIDPKKVKLSGPGVEPNHCRANVPQKFTIDTTKAGKAPVDVQVTSEDGPISKKPVVKNNGDGTHTVEYMPPPVGKKCDVKVTHANQEVPQSPVKMKVLPTCEPNNVKVSGPGASDKPIPASIPVDVIIDAKTAGCGDLKVDVTGPEADPKKVKITDNGDGTYKATYVPEDVGDYKVDVKYGGHPVPKSPFKTKAVPTGQADKCKITEGIQETLNINEEYCITVNAQQAGTGAVTCRVRSSSISAPSNGAPTPVVQPQQGQPGDIDISIEDNGDGTFSIYYTVKESGDYSICVKFGGQNVPNGIYKVQAKDQQQTREIIEEEEVTVVETTTTQKFSTVTCSAPDSRQYNPVSFDNIKVSSTDAGLTAEVKMPSGKIDQPKIIDNKDGTVSVKFDPKEEGLHEMTIKYNHEHVEGSPFSFHVDKLKSGHVTAHGSGLTHGVCGEPCNFTITTKEAGAGGLSLAVEGPSKAEISCKDNKDGTVTVTYLPTAPGEYKVSVKFADKHIIGSPYAPKITGEGRKRNQISVGHSSEVSLKVTEKDIKNLNASIIAPSGLEEPCFVKKLPNGHLGISFTPREKGEHSVNVKRMGNHIAKSPFKIQVGEREIGDASKVKVTGKSLKEGKTQTVNEFSVNTQDAGYGGLSLSIEGPSKADIQCKDNENGTLDVSYKPTEPGYYIINLKFADHHVPGSPYTIKVSGEGSGSQTERIKRDREAVPITEVGNECKFTFRLPGTNPFDMVARVTSPNGQTEDAEIVDLNDSTYAVHFVPKELGVHTISIRHKDIHIPGSPFQFTVGPLKEGGAHKVHAGGPGLERGEINQPCEFNVWTREAGAGHLAISVEGPSKAEIDFQDRKDGSCYVTYKVAEQGEYRVGIKFNDQHIPDSPYKAYITPSINDANKVMIGNLPDNDLHKDKPVNFVIHMNGAKGLPDGKVVGPDGHEDDCFISPVDDEQYALRFVPKMNGVHNIIISLAGAQVPESPLRLRVGKDEADPAVVSAFGNGLINTKTGQKADFIVDTCNAGSGTLAVTIDGPSKVSMDCTEVEEGYKVRYTPLSPGEYYVTVKYSGYHIAGSPFRVPCSGKAVAESSSGETSSVIVETAVKESKFKSAGIVLPKFKSNASKVTCKGLGLKKAYLNKQNQFNVSCVDAGNNMLYVSVIGPKAPVEEVYIKHQGNHSFIVNYMAKERGEHFVVVKYGEDNIPGSPFKVDVL